MTNVAEALCHESGVISTRPPAGITRTAGSATMMYPSLFRHRQSPYAQRRAAPAHLSALGRGRPHAGGRALQQCRSAATAGLAAGDLTALEKERVDRRIDSALARYRDGRLPSLKRLCRLAEKIVAS